MGPGYSHTSYALNMGLPHTLRLSTSTGQSDLERRDHSLGSGERTG